MIRYVTGDATEPLGRGVRIIAHICNDIGLWGAGFTRALSQRWPQPEREYRSRARDGCLNLGTIQTARVDETITVINMIAQRGVRGGSEEKELATEALKGTGFSAEHVARILATERPPIRYESLGGCLQSVAVYARFLGELNVMETEFEIEPGEHAPASVHMPRIGCGLAGGKWEEVEPIIERELVAKGVSVTVYDLPGKKGR